MSAVLIVAAEPFELEGIIRRSARVERFPCPVRFAVQAEWSGCTLYLVAHGAGPQLAGQAGELGCQALKDAGEADLRLVSTGLCGGLDPSLNIGDVFVASSVNEFEALLPDTDRAYRAGRLVSQDRVAATAEEKEKLRRDGALAVEMEAAGVAAVAHRRGAPFYCVRAVSDIADESFSLDLNAARDTDGRFRRVAIVGQALKRPVKAIPELLRLQRNSQTAVAALGDFFGSCRF